MKDLEVFSTVESLRKRLLDLKKDSSVCLVPTMGALHHGHVKLVEKALSVAEIAVVSIFVNPTQFNKVEDLENYPRSLESDIELLSGLGKVIIFAPTVDEVYPADHQDIELDLGEMENVMEGTYRPGHFKGVVNVVKRLFDIVEPNSAIFGWKDVQQLSIIQFMVDTLGVHVEVIGHEIVREPSGLASSSRNRRLSEKDLEDATVIIESIRLARILVKDHSPKEVADKAKALFDASPLDLEYLEIVDPKSLMPIGEWVAGARICIAAYCNGVRLIDNDALF